MEFYLRCEVLLAAIGRSCLAIGGEGERVNFARVVSTTTVYCFLHLTRTIAHLNLVLEKLQISNCEVGDFLSQKLPISVRHIRM
uniref:Uncharacterized protein n=1 Tax=Oryza rufipogon TaxID=4529 RepID=A0A0E0P736_ORYRU